MRIYDEFSNRREAGENIDLDELTPDHLRTMFLEEGITDGMIAELFDVKPSKITYLRRKNGITVRNSIITELINSIPKELQEKAKEELLSETNITKIAKAVTHFAFRNGPIEGIHADSNKNITDQDMEILNKYMVNRLAHIFNLVREERWFELKLLVESMDMIFGHGWDDAEPDDGGMKESLIKKLESYRN